MRSQISAVGAKLVLNRALRYDGRRPLFIQGEPGIGKTAIVEQVAKDLGWECVLSHPVAMEATDLTGLPWISQGEKEARFRPYGDLARMLTRVEPTVWCFDDVGHARETTQAALMHLAHARRINEHTLPDCVRIVATSNRRIDRGAAAKVLAPFATRFARFELVADIASWTSWAYATFVDWRVIKYLESFPAALSVEVVSPDEPTPNPRGWHIASDVLAWELPHEEQAAMLWATLGANADGFNSFLRVVEELPNPLEVLRGTLQVDLGTLATDRVAMLLDACAYHVIAAHRQSLTSDTPKSAAMKGVLQALCDSASKVGYIEAATEIMRRVEEASC